MYTEYGKFFFFSFLYNLFFFTNYFKKVNNWVYANDIYNKFKETPFFKSQKKQIGLDLIDLLALPLPRIEYYHETLKVYNLIFVQKIFLSNFK